MRSDRGVLGLVLGAAVACGEGPPVAGPTLRAEPPVLELGPVRIGGAGRGALRISSTALERARLEARVEGTLAEDVEVVAAPAELLGGGAGEVELVFTPRTLGSRVGTLELSTADGARLSVPISGQGVRPALEVEPPALSFGPLRVGQTATATVGLVNRGAVPLTVVAATREPGTSPEFQVELGGQVRIEVGGTSVVEIVYAPTDALADQGRVVFVDPALDETLPSVALFGEAYDQPVSVFPTNLEFTGAVVGEVRRRVVRVSNISGATVTVPAPSFAAGSGDGAFAFAPAEGWPRALAAGDDLFFDVVFAPLAAGEVQATLRIAATTETPPVSIALSGRARAAAAARAQVEPGVLDFGAVRVGHTARRPLVLYSAGSVPLALTREIEGPGAPFRLVRPLAGGARLGEGAWHALDVEVSPTLDGAVTSSVVVFTDDPDRPRIEVPLRARGAFAPQAALTIWGPVDLGAVPRGERGHGRVRIESSGDAPITVTAVRWRDDAAGRFTAAGAALPAVLPPGAGLDWRVELFDAASLPGPVVGALEVVAGGRTASVSVSARTVAPFVGTPGLVVELAPTSSAGLDLHVVRDGGAPFDAPDDASWCSPGPDWGQVGLARDDPRWARVGEGQRVALPAPAEASYEVWVHHARGARGVEAAVSAWDELGGIGAHRLWLEPGDLRLVGEVHIAEATFEAAVVAPRATEARCH